jgi:hypothetical protein
MFLVEFVRNNLQYTNFSANDSSSFHHPFLQIEKHTSELIFSCHLTKQIITARTASLAWRADSCWNSIWSGDAQIDRIRRWDFEWRSSPRSGGASRREGSGCCSIHPLLRQILPSSTGSSPPPPDLAQLHRILHLKLCRRCRARDRAPPTREPGRHALPYSSP